MLVSLVEQEFETKIFLVQLRAEHCTAVFLKMKFRLKKLRLFCKHNISGVGFIFFLVVVRVGASLYVNVVLIYNQRSQNFHVQGKKIIQC